MIGETMSTPFICHVEWGTPDPTVLEKFLTQLFNWQFQVFAPNYIMYIPSDGGISVGIMQSNQAKAGGTPNVSIRVVDMDSILAKAEGLGGKIVVPKTPMGNGSFAFVAAPDGNLIGLQTI
jgi:predicted enzyme related to lactoylglutathione lyase